MNENDKKAAKAMVDALEIDATPEGIVIAFESECRTRCPAHAPSFLENMKTAIDRMFH